MKIKRLTEQQTNTLVKLFAIFAIVYFVFGVIIGVGA